MKTVIDTYGKFVLELMIMSLLVVNVFGSTGDKQDNYGVFHIIGANTAANSVNHIKYVDFKEVYREECNKSVPSIKVLGTHLEIGSNKLSDYITAYDYKGEALPVIISSIKDMLGTELLEYYDTDSTEIFFSKAGVYTIEAEAVDRDYRSYKCQIQIPVRT